MKLSPMASCLVACAVLAALPEVWGSPGGGGVPGQVVILDQNGIYPGAVTRSQGEFVLFILNRLPNKNETFTLVPSGPSAGAPGPVLQPISTDSLHDHTGLDLVLPPGEYRLQLKNHSKLSVLITITP